jgi:hypothetical protein
MSMLGRARIRYECVEGSRNAGMVAERRKSERSYFEAYGKMGRHPNVLRINERELPFLNDDGRARTALITDETLSMGVSNRCFTLS